MRIIRSNAVRNTKHFGPHWQRFLLVAVGVMLASVHVVVADGMIVAITEHAVTTQPVVVPETDQRAFLFYDESSGFQRLVLDVRTDAFSGEWLWLIPIPHQPASAQDFLDGHVREESTDGLDALFAATEPTINAVVHEFAVNRRPHGFGCSMDEDVLRAIDLPIRFFLADGSHADTRRQYGAPPECTDAEVPRRDALQ